MKERKDDSIRIRLTTTEKNDIMAAAQKEGFEELSDFVREVLRMWVNPKLKRERFAEDFQLYLDDHPEMRKKLGL